MHNLTRSITLRDVILIIVGALLTGVTVRYFLDPAGLVTGGVGGLAIIIRQLSETHLGFRIPLWASLLVLNAPIFLVALFAFGKRQLLRTALAWAIYTLSTFLLPEAAPLKDNLLLTAVFGGILWGAATGILLSARSTSGGTDLLANTIHHYVRSVSVGRILQYVDGAVVLCGLVVFGLEHTLYAIISVFITGYVTDLVLNRGKAARMATIVSTKSDEIAKDIIEVLHRGVTGLNGRGLYTGEDKTVLMCICTNRDIVVLKDIVRAHDEHAFFLVSNVSEAMGEGFMENWS